MLKFVLKDRKVVTPIVTSYPYQQTPNAFQQSSSEVMKEVTRREGIIADILRTLPYHKGDVCIPTNEQDQEKIGDVVILGIVTGYAHLGKDYKWPKNDNPMLVTAKSLKDESTFFCTVNYLKKKNA